MRPKSEIELSIVCRGGRFATRGLTERLTQVLAIMGLPAGLWNIAIVGDAEMKRLHGRHLASQPPPMF